MSDEAPDNHRYQPSTPGRIRLKLPKSVGLGLALLLIFGYWLSKYLLFKAPILEKHGVSSSEFGQYVMFSNVGWIVVGLLLFVLGACTKFE